MLLCSTKCKLLLFEINQKTGEAVVNSILLENFHVEKLNHKTVSNSFSRF